MNISLIAVPYANYVARWGAANGPQAFLDGGLVAALKKRGHTVRDQIAWVELPREQRTRDAVTNLGILAKGASDATAAALERGDFALLLEGDCTHAPGPTGGVARAFGDAGVVWYDAHGDMHTMHSSSTGLLGGMPYGVMLGYDLDDWREAAGLRAPVRAEAAALIGASDLDPEEEHTLRTHPIARLDAADMLSDAAHKTEALLRPRAANARGWYIHLDIDVAGPEEVPGPLTPAPHWPPRAELIASVAAAARSVPVKALGLAAYNPGSDPQRKGVQLGLDLVLAAIDAIAG